MGRVTVTATQTMLAINICGFIDHAHCVRFELTLEVTAQDPLVMLIK